MLDYCEDESFDVVAAWSVWTILSPQVSWRATDAEICSTPANLSSPGAQVATGDTL